MLWNSMVMLLMLNNERASVEIHLVMVAGTGSEWRVFAVRIPDYSCSNRYSLALVGRSASIS